MDILSAMMLLIMVMDPLGNIPTFLAILENVPSSRRYWILVRELLIAYLILLSFLFLGQYFLGFLNLRQESIGIAGGIVLFLIALRMIFPIEGSSIGETIEGEPYIVPLAVPLIAGPSTLATLTLMAQSQPERIADWLLALSSAWAITALILLGSTLFFKLLHQRGLIALQRLMGMILVALSVQMFLDGVVDYLEKG